MSRNHPVLRHLIIYWGLSLSSFHLSAGARSDLSETLEITSLMDMELEDLINVTITSASKKEQKALEAPSSVTVFSRQELLAMGITSVEELLNFVPGLQATREVVYNQGYRVVSRGQSTPQASYNVLFMINGERLNTDLSGGALGLNHFITLANVKQIEVIRGPGSALYGTGAFTGIVNIITITDGKEVVVSGGNLRSRELYTNLSRQGDAWKMSLFARHFEDEGQPYERTYQTGDPDTIHDPRQGDDAYVNVNWLDRFSINFRYMERHLDDFLDGPNLFLAGVNYLDAEQEAISFQYHVLNTQKGKLTLYGNYATTELKQGSGNRLKNRVIQGTASMEEHEWRWGIDSNYRFSPQHELLAGLEWRRPELNERRFVDIDFFTGEIVGHLDDKTPKRTVLGLYLQDQYHFNKALEATLGVRYDRYSDFGSTTNPRLALVYTASPETKFKWMYGQAFRAPSFQQFWTIRLGNPNLEPETVKTAEFAWIQQYSTVQTTLTYFRSRTEDRIDTVLGPSSTRVFANISGLDTAGWELEASAKVDKFFLRLAYTYLTKTVEKPQNVSDQMFSAIVDYQHGLWNFNINGYYHSELEQEIAAPSGASPLITIADYWVWNGAIRYNWNKYLTLVGNVQNLGDEEFMSPTKIANFNLGLPNRGRTYSLGIEIQF